MSIADRIRIIMKLKDLTQAQLGAIGDYSDVAISKIINKGAEPKFGLLSSIVKAYPDINSRWILTGEGSVKSEDLVFDNKVEMLKFIVNNQDEFKKMKSFPLLLNDLKEVDSLKTMNDRLGELEDQVKLILKN